MGFERVPLKSHLERHMNGFKAPRTAFERVLRSGSLVYLRFSAKSPGSATYKPIESTMVLCRNLGEDCRKGEAQPIDRARVFSWSTNYSVHAKWLRNRVSNYQHVLGVHIISCYRECYTATIIYNYIYIFIIL